MSTAPTPLRAATVAGAILAVIFIALSAIVGGINVWRTHAAETFTSQAEQAQSDKASIDQAIKDAKTRLDSVNVDASAAAWCDSVTRSNASSMRDIIKTPRHKPSKTRSILNARTKKHWQTRSAPCPTPTLRSP